MKKVSIMPAVCYVNGKQVTAESFSVVSVADNLFDSVTFKYTLHGKHDLYAGEGKVEYCGIECYSQWDATPEKAYTMVADTLGLMLAPSVDGRMFGG